MIKYHFIILFWLTTHAAFAQDSNTDTHVKPQFNLGFGGGLDYGGFGIRGTFIPTKHLGIFASAGYNLNGVGVNSGAQLLFPKRRHTFYLTGMYGYNGVIRVDDKIVDKATYYGVTAGAGYQLRIGAKGNFWNWEILLPFRNSNFYDDYELLERLGQSLGGYLPVTISVGYHINVGR